MTSLQRRIRRILTTERGSVATSMVFVIFVSITLTAIVAGVTASLAASSSSNNRTAVSGNTAVMGDIYLDSAINGTPSPAGDHCTGNSCSSIAGTTDGDGVRSLSLDGHTGTQAAQTRIQTLRRISPTMITGYDSDGNPVWSGQADTTPHRFSQVVSGGGRSCAIDTDKSAWCWGTNDHGQLGDGTTTNRSAPAKVTGAARFSALSSGTGNTTCGLDDAGHAWCWGANTSGQLGTGSGTVGTDSTTPVNPAGGHTFTALFQGVNTICGTDTAKQTWCWGANPGNGTPNPAPEPVAVSGTHDFTSLSLDANTACGLEAGGKIFCWSSGPNGRTGVAAAPAPGAPVEAAGGRAYKQVALAPATGTGAVTVACARDDSSHAWCWGSNTNGQLGDGSTTDSNVPVAVTGSHAYTSLTVTSSTVCGLDGASHAWCWGSNGHGQLGKGDTTDARDPAAIDTGTEYKALASGDGSWFCGLTAAGAARCWGQNGSGQASPGSTTDALSPAAVGTFTGLRGLSAGSGFACVTDRRSETSCWGQNTVGQTGVGTTAPASTPAPAARKPYTPSTFTGFLKGGK